MISLIFSYFPQGQIQVLREDSVPDQLIDSLFITPALLNEIEFTVELQQENDIDTMGFAVCFKQTLDLNKI
jgi:hypothetical protein